MKVIVTGAKGQLAQDVLRQLEHTDLQVYGVDREELDITNNEAVQAYINKIKPMQLCIVLIQMLILQKKMQTLLIK